MCEWRVNKVHFYCGHTIDVPPSIRSCRKVCGDYKQEERLINADDDICPACTEKKWYRKINGEWSKTIEGYRVLGKCDDKCKEVSDVDRSVPKTEEPCLGCIRHGLYVKEDDKWTKKPKH
ncbi:hypothetical protein ANO11243_051270 [Dothideomycetidae sp. 11243]|nr:hypothetical protein ANO11243_051270 [fungal sp. No.11243]